jgi:peptidoglycan/xylan/chitin deacetylase (PgdA/CDA1 family)
MGKVINTESTGKERNTLMRGIVAALRELMKQKEVSAHSYDLVAYIGLSLLKIDANIDQSVVAWEKRDYWVKADRFRMEWAWAGSVGKDILQALEANDWARIAGDAIKVGQKLSTVKVTERSRIGTPWVGAYQLLKK